MSKTSASATLAVVNLSLGTGIAGRYNGSPKEQLNNAPVFSSFSFNPFFLFLRKCQSSACPTDV